MDIEITRRTARNTCFIVTDASGKVWKPSCMSHAKFNAWVAANPGFKVVEPA